MWEIIKDGSLERLVISVLVFGGLIAAILLGHEYDERLFDIAFVVVGFYFGTTIRGMVH